MSSMYGASASGRTSTVQTKRQPPSPPSSHLRAGGVVRGAPAEDRVGEAAHRVVAADPGFARRRAVEEGDDAHVLALHRRAGDEARREPLVHRAEVAQRRPDALRRGGEDELFAQGSHGGIVQRCGRIASPLPDIFIPLPAVPSSASTLSPLRSSSPHPALPWLGRGLLFIAIVLLLEHARPLLLPVTIADRLHLRALGAGAGAAAPGHPRVHRRGDRHRRRAGGR